MTDEPTDFERTIGALVSAAYIVADLQEASDAISFEETAVALQTLSDLAKQLKMTVDMVEARRRELIREAGDGGMRVGDRLYALRPSGVWRTDWSRLRIALMHRAFYTADGEKLESDEAVVRAFELMQELFLAPSSVPKVTAVRDLFKVDGLSAIARWEHTGEKIEVLDLGTPE